MWPADRPPRPSAKQIISRFGVHRSVSVAAVVRPRCFLSLPRILNIFHRFPVTHSHFLSWEDTRTVCPTRNPRLTSLTGHK